MPRNWVQPAVFLPALMTAVLGMVIYKVIKVAHSSKHWNTMFKNKKGKLYILDSKFIEFMEFIGDYFEFNEMAIWTSKDDKPWSISRWIHSAFYGNPPPKQPIDRLAFVAHATEKINGREKDAFLLIQLNDDGTFVPETGGPAEIQKVTFSPLFTYDMMTAALSLAPNVYSDVWIKEPNSVGDDVNSPRQYIYKDGTLIGTEIPWIEMKERLKLRDLYVRIQKVLQSCSDDQSIVKQLWQQFRRDESDNQGTDEDLKKRIKEDEHAIQERYCQKIPESTDEDLIKRIKEAGHAIQERYCQKIPERPTMLPPVPNFSKYIDHPLEKDLSSNIKADKDRQEDYAAEVTVYRALENLEDNIVVLHSLDYTNRQLKLCKKDFNFDESRPNKVAGHCDFVAVGENYVVIIEVSNVRRDERKTTDKKLKRAFNRKKKQVERTKNLIENMLKHIDSKSDEADQSPFIKWYCAFLSLSSDCEHIFTEEQRSTIIFADSFHSFQEWWKENVTAHTADVSVTEKRMSALKGLLLGLWNIDTQNQVNLAGKCSLGSNIMKVDSQLRDAQITYGFRKPEDPENNNRDLVKAGPVFQGMGIQFLSKEQDHVFQSTEKFLWVNGPAGSGKTMLILGKAIKTAKAEAGKVAIFKNMCEERSRQMYQSTLDDSGIKYKTVSTEMKGSFLNSKDVDDLADNFARRVCFAFSSCDVVLFELIPVCQVTRKFGGLQVINKIITSIVKLMQSEDSQRQLTCFIDEEHCMLEGGLCDRGLITEVITQITPETANSNFSIWIFTDIVQAPHLTAPEMLPSSHPKIDRMMHTYGQLALSRNFRNAFDIKNLLAAIRETIMYSPEQKSRNFIRGPTPVIHLIKMAGQKSKLKVNKVVENEIDKIMDSGGIEASDIGFIGNSEQATGFLREKLSEKTKKSVPVCSIGDIYSAEWPAILFLMDLTDLGDQHHQTSHQLYLALSRARVHCSAVICSDTVTSYLRSMLQKLKKYAKIILYAEGEKRPLPSSEKSESTPTQGGLLPSEVEFSNLASPLEENRESSVSPEYSGSSKIDESIEYFFRMAVRKLNHRQEQKCSLPEIDDHDSLPLHCASRDGQLEEVKHLIMSGERVDKINEEGHTSLYYAIERGNVDLVRYLIGCKADVNHKDTKWMSPLLFAVQQDKVKIVRCLVESGANIDEKDAEWITPLCQSILQKNINEDIIRYFVECGANVNSKNIDGISPLNFAVLRENLEIVRLLVESGADVNSRDKEAFTPLMYAAYKKNLNIMRFLVESGVHVNCKSSEKALTHLHFAAALGYIDIVRFLVKSGEDVNSIYGDGFTPLHFAAEMGNIDIVKLLVESGSNVNSKNNEGLSPLHYAAQKKNLDIERYLIESGAI